MTLIILLNIICCLAVVAGILALHAWAIVTSPGADAVASVGAADNETSRQVIVTRRLAQGVA